ncbi:MAG: alpha/beta fold hydrolase [Alphaproteobacteria bacterium]|nr:alpha/beta fold hydrolase [Alphaproteobacteria bacterium]
MARLDLQLLGYPSLSLDGRGVELSLRKGAALIAYLADARAPVSRELLATLLWPDADSASGRARLRRTMHRSRAALGVELFAADRDAVRLAPTLDVHVDALAFEQAGDAGDFEAAAALYGGDFLDGFALDGCAAFDEWAFFRREALRSRLAQVLERLFENKSAQNDHRAAAVAATRLVGLDPLSERAHQHVIRAHLRADDRAAAERQYEICVRVLADELGVGPDPETDAILRDAAPAGGNTPHTLYAKSQGLHLAYQTLGSGPRDIVIVPGFVTHVERAWEEPRIRSFLTALSRRGRVIIFDRRGIGLSDRVGAAPTAEATAADIQAVMDAAGSRQALLFGASEGGPGCLHLAAEAPDRVAGLVLYGSLAKGCWAADYPFALKERQFNAWLIRMIRKWGGPVEIETFAPSLVGDRRAEHWWSGLLRTASSPAALKVVLEALRDTDVRHLLPHIKAPTLVLHRRGDRAILFPAGRHLADSIPGARLVALEGDDHWFWVGDQEQTLSEVIAFAETLAKQPSG